MVESAAAALAARNAALGSLTALLLGLVGSVVGGWMGSGERMSLNCSNRPHPEHGRAWERRDDLHLALASGAPLTLILILFLIGVGR
jgi:hypothetical protein